MKNLDKLTMIVFFSGLSVAMVLLLIAFFIGGGLLSFLLGIMAIAIFLGGSYLAFIVEIKKKPELAKSIINASKTDVENLGERFAFLSVNINALLSIDEALKPKGVLYTEIERIEKKGDYRFSFLYPTQGQVVILVFEIKDKKGAV